MPDVANTIWFVAGSSGTADFSNGTNLTGSRDLSAATSGKDYSYRAEHPTDKTIWENGHGIWNGTVLARNVAESSAGGTTKVDFAVAPVILLTPMKRDWDLLAPLASPTFTTPNIGAATAVSVATPIVGPTGDSTTALKVTKADLATAVVTVDTTNARVGINKTPGAFDLDVNGAANIGGKLTIASGTVGSPGIAFGADTGCGFYRIGSANVGFSISGTKLLDLSATQLAVVGVIIGNDGSVAAPEFSFISDIDTGIYRIGANNLGVACNGAKVLDVGTSGLGVTGQLTANSTGAAPGIFKGWESEAGNSADNGEIRLGANASYYGRIHFDGSNNASLWFDNAWDDTQARIVFRVRTLGTAKECLRLGPTSTSIRFAQYGAGTLQTDSSGNVTATSDGRLKNITGTFSRGLADLKRIGAPVSYDWKAESGLAGGGIGWTTQDVAKGIPEAVGIAADGHETLADRPLIAALYNAVMALSAEVEELKRQIGARQQPDGAVESAS
jgi:hypothetical protein